MTSEKRDSKRVDTYWERSIRLYLKNGAEKHQVRLVNCSNSGVCVEVPSHVDEAAVGDRLSLLFQAGDETCAFAVEVKWVAPVDGSGKGSESRRLGARIEPGSATNAGLYDDYVRYLYLRKRFE